MRYVLRAGVSFVGSSGCPSFCDGRPGIEQRSICSCSLTIGSPRAVEVRLAKTCGSVGTAFTSRRFVPRSFLRGGHVAENSALCAFSSKIWVGTSDSLLRVV